MSSIWSRTDSGYKEKDSRIKGVASWVLYITVLNTVYGWKFMVNDGGGRDSERDRGRCCGKTVIWLIN